MGRMVYMEGSLAVTDAQVPLIPLAPRLPLSLAEPVSEHGAPCFQLQPDDVDVPVQIPGVDHLRLLLVDADLVLQIKLDDPGAEPVTARRLWIEAGSARRLYLTPLGRWVEEGTATGGSLGTLEDATKQWTYARMVSSRVQPPFTLEERTCRLRVGARSALMTLSGVDLSGPELATMLQSTIDASPIGPQRLQVTWDPAQLRLAFQALVPGPEPIVFQPYLQDGAFLETLGVLCPLSSFAGGEPLDGCLLDLLAGTGAGQRRIVESNTGQVLTTTQDFAEAPDATSTYRLLKPAAGTVTVFGAR